MKKPYVNPLTAREPDLPRGGVNTTIGADDADSGARTVNHGGLVHHEGEREALAKLLRSLP